MKVSRYKTSKQKGKNKLLYLRTREQNGRNSANQLSSTIFLPHPKLTHYLKMTCCSSTQECRVGIWTPCVGWAHKGIPLLMTRKPRTRVGVGDLPVSNLCHRHMSFQWATEDIQPVASGLSPTDKPWRRPMDKSHCTLCPYADVTPYHTCSSQAQDAFNAALPSSPIWL